MTDWFDLISDKRPDSDLLKEMAIDKDNRMDAEMGYTPPKSYKPSGLTKRQIKYRVGMCMARCDAVSLLVLDHDMFIDDANRYLDK